MSSGFMMRRRAMMQAAAAPPADGQLEWIETDGVAYISLGLYSRAPRCIEASVLFPLQYQTMTSIVFGGYRTNTGSSISNFTLLWLSSLNNGTIANIGFTYFYNYGGPDGCPSVFQSASQGTYFDFKCELRQNLQMIEVKEDGGTWVSFNKTRSENITSTLSTLSIFGGRLDSSTINNNAPSGTRLRGATKIYTGSGYTDLYYNLLPWRLNGEVGMIDTVHNIFFGNAAGSGAFTGGPNV